MTCTGHTDIVGHGKTDLSISGQYRYALDAAELDFMATTDHNQTYNMTAKGELKKGKLDALDEYGWWRTQKVADMYLFPGRFVSLYGYERSMEDPGGHRNLIWPERRGELIPGDMGILSENIPAGTLGAAEADGRDLHSPQSVGTAGQLGMARPHQPACAGNVPGLPALLRICQRRPRREPGPPG